MSRPPTPLNSPEGHARLAHARKLHGWRPRGLPAPLGHRIRRWRLARVRDPLLCELDGGLRFIADLADFLQCLLCENGEWEGKIWDTVLARVNPGDVVIDVGAHAGYSVLRLAQAVGPTGHVHAFEPVPSLRAQSQANVEINGFQDRVTIHPQAVSDRAGRARLYYDPLESAGMSSLIEQRFLGKRIEVETVALDSWLASRDLDTVAFVKIDVEGAEGAVLNGLSQTLRDRRVATLLVETHLHVLGKLGDRGGRRALAPLYDAGYQQSVWGADETFGTSDVTALLNDEKHGVAYVFSERVAD